MRAARARPPGSPAQRAGVNASEAGGRILVVGDTTADLQLLTNLLTASGFTVFPTVDGERALECVRTTLADLVLLNMAVPGMDGYEVCRRLKADETTRSIPVILLSVLEDERDKVKGFQAGAVDYVTGPFQPGEVIARIRTQLRLRELTERLEQTIAARTAELEAANAQLQVQLAERKRAEEALRRSETLLNATQRLARVGGWDWDLERRTSFWTEETFRIHGFAPKAHTPGTSEYVDRSLTCYDPDDRPVVLEAFRRCTERGEHYDLEFPFTSADGCRKWIRTTGAAVREDGRITKVVGIIMDVSERKRTEAELAKYREDLEVMVRERTAELESARNKAQQYLAIAGVMLLAIDANRRVSLINQKGCDVLATTPEGVVGRDWFEAFVPERARQDAATRFRRLMAGEAEAVQYLEGPVVTLSGEERLVAWHGVALRDEAGAIIGLLGSGEDITERRREEQEVARLHRDSQERATALEAANKELDAFAYTVSHDLRAPLRHIDGFLGLLRRKLEPALDEEGRRYMAHISGSARKMGELIDDLLAFSRMGRQAMSIGDLDLAATARRIIRELEPDRAGRSIEWRIGDIATVKGDASMLRIVMTNLIANALKFTRPRERAIIEIGSRGGEREIVIFVRDNGVGFDPARAKNLFEVFHRLHSADEFEGTGVGLAIAKRILLRHGGRIWADGEVGKGATFSFSLPSSVGRS